MGQALPWLALHFCIAAVGTWLARRYALRRQLLDAPGERRSHSVATPRGGGIAIVASLLVAACWLGWHAPEQRLMFASFAVGLVLVAGVGWWDDHRPLSPWWRLAVHALAATLLAWTCWHASGWLPAVVAWLAVMALVNIWNFMDGIDGIASTQAALSALAFLFVLAGPWAWLAGALFAACLGFLPFNFPRARIFLGDVGSGALGYALAGLLAVASMAAQPVWLLILPMLPFLVDAGFTLASRILRGDRWWTPHVGHVYQQAARRFGHVAVTLAYLVISFVTLSLTVCMSNGGDEAVQLALIGSCFAVTLALWGWARKGLSHVESRSRDE
ncbi:glycosyltransferase family 4 protein [Pseudoxanthomonas indica]|uniref:UDP-N-acetylmuramyl pentapeptide phosphotransferase/UDP-N-acetylglucosamine-1-phosphate transferase n=1 Tax=Pseudoxanthomonas indica TaxID=428993 RepID=A0A1T5LYQ0_9GAMM|nr:glycosyltransferase family 4 protein [Pseudoxanthomonas indica]GGD42640.1 LPS biosynthesis protein [Pseudoxanthomonas indica]SKC81130.1 UDP-N-acetylmuramyl pentapeptide phosphotransferase/UDP-N-acetylglucosamine-1-phosphate transferase [Pseudoxanthomonas indica]